jgi:hypothetical protein
MNRTSMVSTGIFGLGAVLAWMAVAPVDAFAVIGNVNAGQVPVEKIVILDKARGSANAVTFKVDNAPTPLISLIEADKAPKGSRTSLNIK